VRYFLRSAIAFAGTTVLAFVFALPTSHFPLPTASAAEPPKERLVDQVKHAIDRGVDYLRKQQQNGGHWEGQGGGIVQIFQGGPTSLALLALLNSGVAPDDPTIMSGLAYLRNLEPRDTYVVGLQTMVFAAAGNAKDARFIQRNVDWLINARVMNGMQLQGWSYQPRGAPLGFPGITDNSNSQYALLGLHDGHQAGAAVHKEVWKSIRNYYADTQNKDGGWGYHAGEGSSLTMTTAGLCGLIIAGMELNPGREILLPNGTAKNCGKYAEDRQVQAALQWVGDHFRIDAPQDRIFYNIYGLERTGRLTGLRFIGGHDWYREGCEYLVGKQKDGFWRGGGFDGSAVVSTSFALLFLSKGRTPILISKMAHGPGEDWDNDRNDARNLVAYASRELFKKAPLAWQIFDAKRGLLRGDRGELLTVTGDLLQSPIAYFNGHEAPRFSDGEKELLKEYIEQGGFILAEACCGRKEFDHGFRQLVNQLFPDTPLKPLPADHQIWKAPFLINSDAFKLEGIEKGCKVVVVYSPEDLSCLWEANRVDNGRGLLAFRLGANIVAYATGMELPKPRLTPAEVVRRQPDAQIPRGVLKAAQLNYGADWKPAPNAMRNLMAYLGDKPRLEVAVETEPVFPNSQNLLDYKFLYMHGRNDFNLSDQALENLRSDLHTGGLLLADACCGKKAFDTAFRNFVKKLFPNEKLEPIPVTDELYGKELNGEAIATVRRRQEGETDLRNQPPFLEGIKYKNRWIVIYSKYDIGCALEKHQSPDCLGHDYDSALKLGSAAVLYALKR
jgi:hypothetical protein